MRLFLLLVMFGAAMVLLHKAVAPVAPILDVEQAQVVATEEFKRAASDLGLSPDDFGEPLIASRGRIEGDSGLWQFSYRSNTDPRFLVWVDVRESGPFLVRTERILTEQDARELALMLFRSATAENGLSSREPPMFGVEFTAPKGGTIGRWEFQFQHRLPVDAVSIEVWETGTYDVSWGAPPNVTTIRSVDLRYDQRLRPW